MNPRRPQRAFALVLVLALLSLTLLAVIALAALSKVSDESARANAYRVQARQNALVGLSRALGELQNAAGEDSRITGMAGIAGVPGGSGTANNSTRYWCGVWESNGTFVTWLVSGADNTTTAPDNPIELIGAATVGAPSSTSANVEKQHVVAGKLPTVTVEQQAQFGDQAAIGNYAFVVIDEGGKISAYSPPEQRAISNVVPIISDVMLGNQLRLKTAINGNAAKLQRVISYEQLTTLPDTPLTQSVLQDTFHYVTLSARSVSDGSYATGTININSASTQVWRCILDTYNSVSGVTTMASSRVTSNGNAIGNGFAASSSGKLVNGPFLSVNDFAGSTLLSANLRNTPVASVITPEQFMAAIGNLLRVRSDTFRIRAYGDALNPNADNSIEAVAYCEAIVQRTPEMMPDGSGRRFVITYFRWLTPADI